MDEILTSGASTGQACQDGFEIRSCPQGHGGRDLGAPLFSFNNPTEISAYILGFWLADGGISVQRRKRGPVYKRFGLFNTDLVLMEKLSYYVNSKITKPAKRPHCKKQLYVINKHSNELFDFCYNIIGNTKKSNNLHSFRYLNEKTLNHTVRGFFDGDGSIFYKKYKTRHGKVVENLMTSFAAGADCDGFLIDLNNILNKRVGVQIKKITGKTNKHLMFGQYDTKLLCEWMYKDASLFMKRKKQIWDESDKIKLAESIKYRSN